MQRIDIHTIIHVTCKNIFVQFDMQIIVYAKPFEQKFIKRKKGFKLVCSLYIFLGLQGSGTSLPNVTSSGNVSYNTDGHTVRMSAQADLTCSDNISYATVKKVNKEDTDGSTVATSHTAVYDEVAPSK